MNVPLKVVCIMELERFNLEDAPEIQQEEEQSEDKSRCPWIKCSIHDTVAKWMLPEEARATYLERANCIPPPIFILAISLAELAAFIYYAVWKPQKQWITLDMGIWESPFIYRPDKRKEAWRFLSYMFLHAGLEHIIGNLVLQLCLGIPLELVHKGHRVGAVYLAGVIAELPRNDSSVWSCKTAVHQPNSWNRCRICFVQKISLSFKWASGKCIFPVKTHLHSLSLLVHFATVLINNLAFFYFFSMQTCTRYFLLHYLNAAFSPFLSCIKLKLFSLLFPF
ncbi:rhomboid-related protein 2 isoform X4 [Python bivittatus]|uniref:rhomboid protease n=1 Tax=Python bivittatus TaxID=176946 RepID=A0A9F2WJ72_PYTBI|nr:rhomboid-related protein 2 isoform X4 [Python bivittatus]